MYKLAFSPQANIKTSLGESVIETDVGGGAPKSRVDIEGSWMTASVTFNCNRARRILLYSFYHTALNGGVDKFLIDLMIDDELVEYTAKFKANSLKQTGTSGKHSTHTATLYVEPIQRDSVGDLLYVEIYGEYLGNTCQVIDDLDYIVNTSLPNTLVNL